MAAAATSSAEDLQAALEVNVKRLRSAWAYMQHLRDSDGEFGEVWECWETMDRLLDERIALRARL